VDDPAASDTSFQTKAGPYPDLVDHMSTWRGQWQNSVHGIEEGKASNTQCNLSMRGMEALVPYQSTLNDKHWTEEKDCK
jgi:hypothetical protein